VSHTDAILTDYYSVAICQTTVYLHTCAQETSVLLPLNFHIAIFILEWEKKCGALLSEQPTYNKPKQRTGTLNDFFLVMHEVLTLVLLNIQVLQLFTPRQPIKYAFTGYRKIL